MRSVYEFKSGSRITIDPIEASERLTALADRNDGQLTPEAVVEDARRKNSPLHDHFCWDDKQAAAEHRLQQARHLLNCLVVRYVDEKEEDASPIVRAFYHIPMGDSDDESDEVGGVYVESKRVFADEMLRQRVLHKAKQELDAWRRRYADLQEFARIFDAIELVKV